MRRNAPADISDDVNRSLDSLVVGNYPSAAHPSMEEMPPEERQAAAARMMAYVEQHCVDRRAEIVDPEACAGPRRGLPAARTGRSAHLLVELGSVVGSAVWPWACGKEAWT